MANDFRNIDPEIFKILSRRLHKKLKVRVSKDEHSNLTLSQLQEDMAQALGYKNLHDVQQSWRRSTSNVSATALDQPSKQGRSQIDYSKYDFDGLMERELFLELFPVYQQLAEVAALGERKVFEDWCDKHYVDLLQMRDASTGARRCFNVLANVIAVSPGLSDILIDLGDKLTIDDIADWTMRHHYNFTNAFPLKENEGVIKKRLFLSLDGESAFWGIHSSRVSSAFKEDENHLINEVNNHLLEKGLSYALSDLYVKNPNYSKLSIFKVISNGMLVNGDLVSSFVSKMEEKYGPLDQIYNDIDVTYQREYVSACAAWGDLKILLSAERYFPDAVKKDVSSYHAAVRDNALKLSKYTYNRLKGAIDSGDLPVFEHVIKDYSSACYEYALAKALVMGHDGMISWLDKKGVVLHEKEIRDTILDSIRAGFSSHKLSNEAKINIVKRVKPFIAPGTASLGSIYVSSFVDDFLPENKKFIEYLRDYEQLDVNYLVGNENLFDRAPQSKRYVVGVMDMLLDLGVDPARSRGGYMAIAGRLLKGQGRCLPVIKKLIDKIRDPIIANSIMGNATNLSQVKALSHIGLKVTVPAVMTWINNIGLPGNAYGHSTAIIVCEMIGWSVKNGLDVNGVDDLGNTLLHHTVGKKDSIAFPIIDRLSSCGARIDIQNKEGKTCVDLAPDDTQSCLKRLSRRKMKP